MLNFSYVALFMSILLSLTSCGGSKSTIGRVDSLSSVDGTFLGKDNSNRDATVIVDSNANTIDISLRTGAIEVNFAGDIILSSVASTGKKMAIGDISYNVDLKITASTVEGFETDGTSYGQITKTKDANGTWQYACTFNFTGNTNRGTDSSSDWSMSGVAQ